LDLLVTLAWQAGTPISLLLAVVARLVVLTRPRGSEARERFGFAFSIFVVHALMLLTSWTMEIFHVEYYPVWDDVPAEQIDALVQQVASSGRAGPSFGVFGLGQLDLFGILELRGRKPPPDSLPTDRSDAWKSLDVSLLHTLLVDPLIAESGHPREQVLRYTRSPHEAVAEVLAGKADVAFFLNPTPVSSVLAVADAGDLMPEKSTYFFPKPPAGLVMRDLDSPT